jgi:hypothetical protein
MKLVFSFIIFLFGFCISQAQESVLVQTLVKKGFENVASINRGNDLYITYENNLYRFEAKGLASAVSVLLEYDFGDFENIHLLLRRQDIPMALVTLSVYDLELYKRGLIDSYTLTSKMNFSINVINAEVYFNDAETKNPSFFKIDVPVGLELDYALGDFNDGLMTRFYVNPRLLSTFGKGLDIEFKYQNIVQNDIPGSAKSYPIILKMNQSMRFNDNSFLSASLGYLPQNKFGLHTRFRRYLDQERFYVEFLYGMTRLGYLNERWTPVGNRNSDAIWQAIFNFRWNKFDTDVNVTYGTFFSGDLGYKLQFTRQFNEVYFNLFYARTDIVSTGSFGSKEDGIIGFSLTVPFGQSKYMKPSRIRLRTEDQFDLLYRYSGFSLSGIDIIQGTNIFSDIREFYPEILKKGLLKHLN